MTAEKKAALMAALIDWESCPVESIGGGKFRFHLKNGPVDVERQVAIFIRWKRKSA